MASIQGYTVVDDQYRALTDISSKCTGYIPRDYKQYPLASLKCARPFSQAYIPKEEYKERIEEKTAKKTWIRDKCDRVGSKVKNQSSSNYCWVHAPVRGMECMVIEQGGVPFTFSAFYPGAQIKRGRNVGGSGIEAVEWLSAHGTCVESLHEPMDFSTNVSQEVVRNGLLHQILAYEDLDPSDDDAIITKLLTDKPVTVGIPAWGHEVLITFLLWENGKVIYGIDNSWGTDWGNNGRGVLQGRMSKFDEAGSIEVVEASST